MQKLIYFCFKGYKDGSYGGAQKALMVAQVKDMDKLQWMRLQLQSLNNL